MTTHTALAKVLAVLSINHAIPSVSCHGSRKGGYGKGACGLLKLADRKLTHSLSAFKLDKMNARAVKCQAI